MSDYEFVENAMTMLGTAEVVNKFTDTVWVCMDRQAWDRFEAAVKGEKDENASVN